MRITLCISILLLSVCQLFSQEQLEVEGAIIIENNSDPSPVPGTIRWNGIDFEGYTNSGWKSLTSCNCPCCTDPFDPTFVCFARVFSLNSPNNPSITVDIYDIIEITQCGNELTASFSNDINDTSKVFTCGDLGDVQVTIFVWENGAFREPCFAIIQIVDSNAFCL